MRLSFVQRLKNEKLNTATTRDSEEKSGSESVKIKSRSLKTQRRDLDQHCDEIKKLISVLEQTKNPQFQLNTPKLYAKAKTQEKKQIYHELRITREQKKQNSQKLIRPSSSKSTRQPKPCDLFISKKTDVQNSVDFDLKFNPNGKQSLLYDPDVINVSPNKLMLYRFPGKRNLESGINKLPPILPFKDFYKQKQSQKIQINDKFQQCSKAKVIEKNQAKRGLENIGNTCYINSIVQCLFHLQNFNGYFLNRNYLRDNHPNKKQKQDFNSDRSIIEKYRQLYLYVTKGQTSEKGAKKSTYSLKLALYWQQEDAHEFMRKLLDAMHQQINRCTSSSPYKLLRTKAKLHYSSISSLADEYFEYFRQKDDSYIYDSFGGQLYNNIDCINCHSQSISFQNCLDLSLPLVKGKHKLEQLLDEFFGKEKLSDYYKCEHCNQVNKNSTKTTKFWRTPQILIIQLKRSQFGKKNLNPITFPTDVLSLQNYINDENEKVSQKYANYSLKSVVCHRGAAQSGHYWSVIKEFGQWFQIDDERVAKLQQAKVKQEFETVGSSQAYILFYESMSR